MSVPYLRLALPFPDDRTFSTALLPSDIFVGMQWTDTFQIEMEDYGTASWETIMRVPVRAELFPSVAKAVRDDMLRAAGHHAANDAT
jgi:hypothetical protein